MRGGRVAVLALLAVSIAAGCSDDSSQTAQDTTTRGTNATTSTGPTTTDDTSSVTIGIICSTPEDAASTVVSAWTADEREAARRCASDAVVDQLFQTSGAGNTWANQGCDATDPAAPVCAYSYEGGAAFLTTTGSNADGWKVTRLQFLAD
jgi:hypothetical protein